jgi:HEAT repeat-containing protein 5
MVRLRLYETLTLLPSTALESSYTHLLRMLVSEFTLTENQANTTTSLLRDMCNAEDSIILGTWLEETDHRYIEDQVTIGIYEKNMLKNMFQSCQCVF